jgi:hypothetical protein
MPGRAGGVSFSVSRDGLSHRLQSGAVKTENEPMARV